MDEKLDDHMLLNILMRQVNFNREVMAALNVVASEAKLSDSPKVKEALERLSAQGEYPLEHLQIYIDDLRKRGVLKGA